MVEMTASRHVYCFGPSRDSVAKFSHIHNSTDLSFDLAAPDLGLGLGQICAKNEGGVIFMIAW